MYERILFPTDGGEVSESLYEFALELASAHDATLHVLNVADTNVESMTLTKEGLVDILEREGQRVVDEAADGARERGIDVVETVLRGEPYSTIVEYAQTHGVDLVVMPTHGRRGLDRFLLGSVTERVVRTSDVPVLTIRPGVTPAYPFENVLVPTDGSDCANAAVEHAASLASASGASLHALSAIQVAALGVDAYSGLELDVLEERAEEALEAARSLASEHGLETVSTATEYGTVHGQILRYVKDHDVDVVVLGTHGRTGFDRYLLGSVAEKLIRTSPVPVLTVRAPEAAEE